MSEKEEMKKEGARGFGVIITEIEGGDLHTELSTKLQALLKEQTDHANFYNQPCVGKLSLELTIKVDEKGVANLVSNVKVTPPKRKRSATTMYITPGNNLSVANPRQLSMPIREVPRAKPELAADDDQPKMAPRAI